MREREFMSTATMVNDGGLCPTPVVSLSLLLAAVWRNP
jgi:hypothetical protein